MATSTTKDSAVRRERRGASPSTSRNPQRRSASAGKASSSTATETTAQSDKHIPNYLKPTISSRHDSFKFIKKNNSNHEDNQSNKLLRRRSFDKPPSSSPRIQKALISPGPRDRLGAGTGPVLREKTVTVRSKSFSSKSTATSASSTTTKHVLDTKIISKTPRPIKSQVTMSFPRTSKKGTNSTVPPGNRNNNNNNNNKYKEIRSSSNNNNNNNNKKDEEEIVKESDMVDDVEEIVKVEDSDERDVQQDISESMEADSENKVINVDNTKLDDEDDGDHDHNNEDEKIKTGDVSVTASDHHDHDVAPSDHSTISTANSVVDRETDRRDHDRQIEDCKTTDGGDHRVEGREYQENPSGQTEITDDNKDAIKAAEESSGVVLDQTAKIDDDHHDHDHQKVDEIHKREGEKGKCSDDVEIIDDTKEEKKGEDEEINDSKEENINGDGENNENNKAINQEEASAKEEASNNEEVKEKKKEESHDENQVGQTITEQIVAEEKPKQEVEVEAESEIRKQTNTNTNTKKESPSAYNDVIEETASKLLEKRKNKVKALVGAFETVIDYETPTNNNNNSNSK